MGSRDGMKQRKKKSMKDMVIDSVRQLHKSISHKELSDYHSSTRSIAKCIPSTGFVVTAPAI